LPRDIGQNIEAAFQTAQAISGFLADNERRRFVGTLAASTPARGVIVEIESFKSFVPCKPVPPS
jgi:hypothetical protein